jgi:hypothetical protein
MVQFRVSSLFGLRVEADGILIAGPRGLQLVFNQPTAEQQGLLDAQPQTVEIAWRGLTSWKVDYGVLGDRVTLSVASVDMLRNLPGVSECTVDLQVRKQQRPALQDFEQRAKEYESGQRHDSVDETIDEIRDFLQGL